MTLDRTRSTLLLVDFQERLMPAIHDGATVVRRAAFLAEVADLLGVAIVVTEENPAKLGHTIPALERFARDPIHKRYFDACRSERLLERLGPERRSVVAAGCESHVCVLQTVLGLIAAGFSVAVASDAVGSRRADDKTAALSRMAAQGAELVTAEMVAFEWLESCDSPGFREVIALVKAL